jgi:hypothetical protein
MAKKATAKKTAETQEIPAPPAEVSTESNAPAAEITDQGVEDPTPHPAEAVDSPAVLNADTPTEGPYVEDPESHEFKPSAQGSDLASKIQNS